MAAAAGLIMGVIGLAMGGVSMVPLSKSFAPDKTDETTTVRIGVGTSLDSSATTGGNVPGVALFDTVGRKIGESKGSKDKIGDGSFKDIKVVADGDVGGRQAEYVSISKGGNDALCVAYVTMTWPDNSKYIFSGDVGYSCGGFWYNSQTTFGEANPGYKPKCFWIDGDASNGIKTQGFGLHITDFEATKERSAAFAKNQDLMCKSPPRFKLYNDITSGDSLPYFDPPLEFHAGTLLDMDEKKVLVDGSNRDDKHKPSRRRIRNSQMQGRNATSLLDTIAGAMEKFAGHLITSNDTMTSAVELCESKTSLGPDHVSFQEQKFCDMQVKQVWPLCQGNSNGVTCFDTKTNSMRKGQNPLGRRLHGRDAPADSQVPDKSYHTVKHWH